MKNLLTTSPNRIGRSLRHPLSQLERDIDRLWEEENLSMLSPINPDYVFSPTCSMRETDKEYIVNFDLPGVDKNDVDVELVGQRLTVSGERKESNEEKSATKYFSESYQGSFIRSFDLPSEVSEDKIDAKFKNGVLNIKIPKSGKTKETHIKIN